MTRIPQPRPAPGSEPPAPAGRPATRYLALLLVPAVALAGAWWWHTASQAPTSPPAAPQAAASAPALTASYVDNQQCLGCHPDQGRQWQQSHHAQAMAAPTEQTVRGDFNNAAFKHQGVTSRFFRRGDKFIVRTDGPDGKLADFEVSYTFGVAPLQQYLIALPGGRLQPLQIAWDSERRRWFHLLPAREGAAGRRAALDGPLPDRATRCASVATPPASRSATTPAPTRFASRWSEPNVSCQSCHGPGRAARAMGAAAQAGPGRARRWPASATA